MDDFKQLVVRVDPMTLHKIERAAERAGVRRIDWVRSALAYALKYMPDPNRET